MWKTQRGKLYATSNIVSYLKLALEDVIKFKSKYDDFLSMATIEVPAIISMFPPHVCSITSKVTGICSQVESQLRYKVFFFTENEVPGKYTTLFFIPFYDH